MTCPQVSRLMIKCCNIAEELSETETTAAKGRERRALNHPATLHSCLSPPFMFTVTLVLCSSFLTWQFVKLGGFAKLKTFADRNPQTNHPDRQVSRWYGGCLGGRNHVALNSPTHLTFAKKNDINICNKCCRHNMSFVCYLCHNSLIGLLYMRVVGSLWKSLSSDL